MIKNKITHIMCLLIVFCGKMSNANNSPQSQVSLAPAATGTWAVDWVGVEGRTYFFQWSTNLVNWNYAPFLDFGVGAHSRGFVSDASRFNVRLKYVDDPSVETQDEAGNADFDGDGMSNLFEVALGYDPLNSASNINNHEASHAADSDGDGLSNGVELNGGTNSTNPNNPDSDGDGIPDGLDVAPLVINFVNSVATSLQVITPMQ